LTINSIRMGQNVTVNAGATLTLGAGVAFLNGGTFVGGGAVTSAYAVGGTADLYLHGPASGTAAVTAAVVDTAGTPVRLVQAGPGNLSLGHAPVARQAGHGSGTRFTGTFSGTGDVTVTNNAFTGVFNKVVIDSAGANSFGNVYLAANATLQLGTGATTADNRQVPDASHV